jgi:hypothetical protein
MRSFLLCSLAAFALCCCTPSDDASEEAALLMLDKHKEDMYLEKNESDISDSFLAIGNVVLQASKTDLESIEQKNKQIKERIDAMLRKIRVAAGRELNVSPCLIQAEDFPDEMPRVYKVQFLGALHVGDTKARY